MDHWVVICIGIVVAVAAAAFVGTVLGERRRTREVRQFARSMGFTFKRIYWLFPPEDFGRARSFTHAGAIRNVVHGTYNGRRMVAFDCESQEQGAFGQRKSAGRRSDRGWLSVCLHRVSDRFPDLHVRRNRALDVDLAGFLRSDDRRDVQFESDEFNRAIRVSTDDRRFAFDVCHPQMMEWLMAHREWEIAFVNGLLGLKDGTRWSADGFRAAFDLAGEFLDRIPEHVWREYGGEGRQLAEGPD